MKYFIRSVLFNVFSLWFTSQVLRGLVVKGNWQIILLAGLTLSLLNLIVKPVLSILFVPINFLTFGLISWFINVIVIYLLTILVPEVVITAWVFPGVNIGGFIIPQIKLSYFTSLIIIGLTIMMFANILEQLSE